VLDPDRRDRRKRRQDIEMLLGERRLVGRRIGIDHSEDVSLVNTQWNGKYRPDALEDHGLGGKPRVLLGIGGQNRPAVLQDLVHDAVADADLTESIVAAPNASNLYLHLIRIQFIAQHDHTTFGGNRLKY